MNVTRDEAALALAEIGKAGEKVGRLKGYHQGAPHFVLWGLVWLGANVATQFGVGEGLAWPVGTLVGFAGAIVIGVLQNRGAKSPTSSFDKRIGMRIGLVAIVVAALIFCLINIAQPHSNRQLNAMISILFPFMYMLGGIWAGWRLFAIGFVTAAAILFGFYFVKDWFDLWMGVVGGGSLIASGIWLRTA
jgi:hypothetical protein